MYRLAKYNPTVSYPTNVPGHCAYINYTEEIITPENARDELELKDIRPVCGECPFYEKAGDHRVKAGKCLKDLEPKPYWEKPACTYLCEMVLSGAIDLGYRI